jgi:WD40 repeat protein
LASLPDGKLASGAWDGTVRIWDVASGAHLAIFAVQRHWVHSLIVLPDGKLVSINNTCAWDVTNKKELFRVQRARCAVLLPDGKMATGSDTAMVHILDLSDVSRSIELSGHTADVSALAVLHDGTLASGSWDRSVHLWNKKGAYLMTLLYHPLRHNVDALAVLSNGELAVAAGPYVKIFE